MAVAFRRPGAAYKPAVRVLSVLFALGFMFLYSRMARAPQADAPGSHKAERGEVYSTQELLSVKAASDGLSDHLSGRHLLF